MSRLVLIAVFALLPAVSAAAEIPPLTGPVVDRADLLDPASEQAISGALHRFQEQTSNQLQVLTVPSLEGGNIDEYAIRVAEQWQLGTAEKDNGVLLVIAAEDRAWRIEVGGGLEGDLTDVQASRIGRGILVPRFREGRYAEGIAATLQAVAAALGGELQFTGLPRAVPQSRSRGGIGGLIFLVIMLLVFFGGRGRGGGLFAGLLLGSMLGGGFRGGRHGGGGGFGGGGWGGGGGGFSGGGASGSW